MTEDLVTEEIKKLKDGYGEVTVATINDSQTLIRIQKVCLPRGVSPSSTPVVLVIPSGQSRPLIYVKPGIKLSNGVDPRSTSLVQVAGEGWLQFSYSFPWEWNSHTLVQFVEAALRRFAKLE